MVRGKSANSIDSARGRIFRTFADWYIIIEVNKLVAMEGGIKILGLRDVRREYVTKAR